MTAAQWIFWVLGLVSSFIVLVAAAFTKGGPEWYWPLLIAASAYTVLSTIAAWLIRRRRLSDNHADAWVAALSTSRPGVLGLIAILLVVLAIFVFRVGR
ncbi:hypothetical protein PLCT1_01973 [Planctomycetaceae bacterium]|nr:hypothetical protein PLCT1_01973 [Planctomycetaceae bacterium]